MRTKLHRNLICSAIALVFVGAGACKSNTIDNSSTVTNNLGAACTADNECKETSCIFSYCRKTCSSDSECDTKLCLAAADGSKGCGLATEKSCSSTSCATGLVCGRDGVCRTRCDGSSQCSVPGQTCNDGQCEAAGSSAVDASATSDASNADASADAAAQSDTGVGTDAGTTCGARTQTCCAGAMCAAGSNLACTGGSCACDLGFANCAGSGPTCPDNFSSSGDHCGRCGHSCGGGACTGSTCQALPLVVSGTADGQTFHPSWAPVGSAFNAIAFRPFDAAGSVFPSTNQATGLVQLRAFGPTGTPGAFLTTEAAGIAINFGPWVSTTSVFWTDNTAAPYVLRRVARGGGAASTIYVATEVTLDMVRFDSDVLYVRDGSSLVKIPPGTVTPTPVYGTGSIAGGVYDVRGAALFFVDGGRRLLEGSTTGAALVNRYASFVPVGCEIADIHVTDDAVYGYGACNTDTAYIVRWERGTGTYTTLLANNAGIRQARALTVVGTSVIFSDNTPPYRTYTLPISGGAPAVLFSNGPYAGTSVAGGFVHAWRTANGSNGLSAYVRFALP